MSELRTGFLDKDARMGLVRLRTLIILRWLAIFGQTVAVLVAAYLLEIEIELGLCFAAIGASVIINLITIFIYPENRRLLEREVLLTLLFDLSQLAFLLYLTGGLNNPFALLILAPVTVSAMTLAPKPTFAMAIISLFLVSFLAFNFIPLRTQAGTIIVMPPLFIYGFWIAMMIGIVFLGFYARRVTSETMSMSQALLATQMALSREQKLTDLGGVVAAAAHELGTPLATIKLASSELVEELADRPELREDATLIMEQADRCRDILRSMGRSGKDDLHLKTAPLSTVVEEAAEPHHRRGKVLHFQYGYSESGDERMPNIYRRPEIVHGLRNLVQNAVDFAKSNVWIDVFWTETSISIRVIDDGKGYPPDLLGRIGDPFIRRRDQGDLPEARPEYEGMGLGLFIAKTLLERSGAEISFANASGGEKRSGAIAEVVWPTRVACAPATGQSEALGENRPIEI